MIQLRRLSETDVKVKEEPLENIRRSDRIKLRSRTSGLVDRSRSCHEFKKTVNITSTGIKVEKGITVEEKLSEPVKKQTARKKGTSVAKIQVQRARKRAIKTEKSPEVPAQSSASTSDFVRQFNELCFPKEIQRRELFDVDPPKTTILAKRITENGKTEYLISKQQ